MSLAFSRRWVSYHYIQYLADQLYFCRVFILSLLTSKVTAVTVTPKLSLTQQSAQSLPPSSLALPSSFLPLPVNSGSHSISTSPLSFYLALCLLRLSLCPPASRSGSLPLWQAVQHAAIDSCFPFIAARRFLVLESAPSASRRAPHLVALSVD